MPVSEKAIDNNVLAKIAQKAAPTVVSAIKKASARTGVDFAYLMEKAAAESSLNPAAKARSSSATGLFQFIESTWLRMVKAHGGKYGMEKLADGIDTSGRVRDPALRKEILALRRDPEKAAALAAEYALENKKHLQRHVGGDIGATELYLAHFMGAGGASGFLNAMKENPLAAAADLFPKAARANRNIFYDSATGQPRTLAGIYDMFDRKFSGFKDTAGQMRDIDQRAPQAIRDARASSVSYDLVATLHGGNDSAALDSLPPLPTPSPFRSVGQNATSGLPRGSLTVQPVEIMMLASLPMPSRSAYND